MKKLIDTILADKRKRFLVKKPIYQTSSRVNEMDLFRIAKKLDCKLSVGLSKWLLTAGYGDIEQSLSFREEWFCLLENGPLKGKVVFAHDDKENTYAYDPKDGAIYFVGKDGFSRMADNFRKFLQELVQRNYNLAEWRDSLKLQHYGDSTNPQAAA